MKDNLIEAKIFEIKWIPELPFLRVALKIGADSIDSLDLDPTEHKNPLAILWFKIHLFGFRFRRSHPSPKE